MSEFRPLSGRCVLVVEDDYLLAQDTRDWLENAGAEVLGPTPSAEQALELIDDRAIRAAVLDINLGEGPVYAVATHLQERGVPFLFATGYDRAVIPEEFRNCPRLEKPFSRKDLVAAVRQLV